MDSDKLKPLSVPETALSRLYSMFHELIMLESFSLSEKVKADLLIIRSRLAVLFYSLVQDEFFEKK